MGTTVFLSQLSATTELLVIDLVTQQDPESDPQLSCGPIKDGARTVGPKKI
jgi:hypothetical protein